MKLVCLLTYGLGDWYHPLSVIPSIKAGLGIVDVKLYVDCVYFAYPGFESQKQTGISMLNVVTKDWEVVPPQYFGSGDWYGIPNRIIGPQYNDIKNDFCFYRGHALKSYMRNVYDTLKQKEPITFLVGQQKWTYIWNGVENIPIDFSKREPLKFSLPNYAEKEKLDKILSEPIVLIHVRKKGRYINDDYFQQIINYCDTFNLKTALIGLKSESILTLGNNTYDFRESLSPEGCMYLIERSAYMITSGSMYTMHRLYFNKPTIIGLHETFGNGDRNNTYFKEDLDNPNYLIFNSDEPNLNTIFKTIKTWNL